MTVTIGVSLKMYFGLARAAAWCADVARLAALHPGVTDGAVELFVAPTYLQVPAAVATFAGTRVRVAVQDVAADDAGPFTGEVGAAEAAEAGVGLAEVGHAERRRLFHETDDVVARKAAAALRHGLTPVVCVGEEDRTTPQQAARETLDQLGRSTRGVPDGGLVVAYEPVWAIGAPLPAPAGHIRAVAGALGDGLRSDPARQGSRVLYGGSAGPGLLTALGTAVDGLFLGRFAHDVGALETVLDEARSLAGARA
ncbi:triose-phosphate isomerase family protein [Promicromonospora sp. NPDC057488]|uniref:triose-phosphate isomerase family protein n=1 Tax=Promicromonospora sp. NPDC057488 TaxID=3346147 RepID=UPI00366C0490